jgi:hypothetical protein
LKFLTDCAAERKNLFHAAWLFNSLCKGISEKYSAESRFLASLENAERVAGPLGTAALKRVYDFRLKAVPGFSQIASPD